MTLHINVFISENVSKEMCFVGHKERLETHEAMYSNKQISNKYWIFLFIHIHSVLSLCRSAAGQLD